MRRVWATAAIAAFGAGMGMAKELQHPTLVVFGQATEEPPECRFLRSNSKLPTIPLAELSRHCCMEDRLWVTFKGGVYDITEFTGHPGGIGRLEMAAGGDLEPFWRVYTQHNRGHIYEYMQRYRIGNLSPADAKTVAENLHTFPNPYVTDPPASPDLLTNTTHPYNAEGRLATLADTYITPVGKHFVRNHCNVPLIEPEEYELVVQGPGVNTTTLTYKDLQEKFEQHSVTTVIQCNGNRREDYHFLTDGQPAFGPPHWVAGAIGNATWSGPRMRDVLAYCGLDVDAITLRKKTLGKAVTDVTLSGGDCDEGGNHYCASIPFQKAVDPWGDVLLALNMNGETIPKQHGFPVRCIVPGHAGARNVKYLSGITLADDPCQGQGNWKQYAVHAPDVPVYKLGEFDKYHVELKQDPIVQQMPVQSMICQPPPHTTISPDAEEIEIKGIAWGGGGRAINRVDVSLDNGEHFTRADVETPPIPEQHYGGHWGWYRFTKTLPIPEEVRARARVGQSVPLTLTSKALNDAWNVQPEHAVPNMNPHGCCVNHWYRVPVSVDKDTNRKPEAPQGLTVDTFENKPSGGYFTRPFRNFSAP